METITSPLRQGDVVKAIIVQLELLKQTGFLVQLEPFVLRGVMNLFYVHKEHSEILQWGNQLAIVLTVLQGFIARVQGCRHLQDLVGKGKVLILKKLHKYIHNIVCCVNDVNRSSSELLLI